MSFRDPFSGFINTLLQVLEQIDKHFLTVHNHVLWETVLLVSSQHLHDLQQVGNKGLKKSRKKM